METMILKSPIGPDWNPASRVFVFFAWGSNPASLAIINITGGPSHMGIGFLLEDGSAVYYENLFGSGFQGPKPVKHLLAWSLESVERHVEIFWLKLAPELCERKHLVAHTWVGLVGYAEWKILSFLFFESLGRKVGIHIRPSWNRWVCSTSVASILSQEIDLSTPERSLAEVTPESARNAIIYKQLYEVRTP